MLWEKENTSISKLLSLVLRHQQQPSLSLSISFPPIYKKRFASDDTKTKIRASQGNSLNVALGLKEASPQHACIMVPEKRPLIRYL